MSERRQRTSIPLGKTTKTVASNIRQARERRGITQEDLSNEAKELGHPLEVPAIRAIENGRRRIDVDDLTVIAAILHVSPATLLKPLAGQSLTGVPDDTNTTDLVSWVLDRQALQADDEEAEALAQMKALPVRIRELEAHLAGMGVRLREIDEQLAERNSSFNSLSDTKGAALSASLEDEKRRTLRERGYVLLDLEKAKDDLDTLEMIYG